MKTSLITTAFICIALFLGTTTGIGQSIRKLSIDELETYIRNSDHPLVVNFWAVYCKPCVEEIPYFQTIVEKYAGVELLLVSLDLPDYYPSKIIAFAKKKNFNAHIVWLNETNADVFCPRIDNHWSGGIPSSLFVNNKTGYRRFFERQLTQRQVEENIQALVMKGSG